MIVKFTDRGIAALCKKSKRYEEWEDGRTGFGVRIAPTGRKSWIYMYRFNGKSRRMTIGTYPALSLGDARLKVAQAKQQLERGDDPGVTSVEEHRQSRSAPTVSQLVDEYLEKWARPRKRSASEDERILTKDVLPVLGSHRARNITRGQVNALLDRIVARGAGVQANRTLAVVRKMFNFAVSRGIVDASPCTNISAPAKEEQRSRVLSAEEIAAFWHRLDRCAMSEGVRIALKLQLITAQRKGEIINARWDEIADDVWTISARIAKNGKAHRVPLTQPALSLLKRLREMQPDSEWLFPSPTTAKPITAPAVDHALRNNLSRIGLEYVTPHDLRRTAASHMTSLGVSRLVVQKILNHTDQGVTAVYDRHSYDPEKRAALESWARRLIELVGDVAVNGSLTKAA